MRKRDLDRLRKVQEKTEREMDWVANLRQFMVMAEGCMYVQGCREVRRKTCSILRTR